MKINKSAIVSLIAASLVACSTISSTPPVQAIERPMRRHKRLHALHEQFEFLLSQA